MWLLSPQPCSYVCTSDQRLCSRDMREPRGTASCPLPLPCCRSAGLPVRSMHRAWSLWSSKAQVLFHLNHHHHNLCTLCALGGLCLLAELGVRCGLVCLGGVLFFVFETRFLCVSIPGCARTHYVNQAVLELKEVCLLLPHECWD